MISNKFKYFIPFTLSGMNGLILQVVWSRYFNIVFGSTIYSVSMVLASFMLGLSLGSFWISRNIDKYENKYKLFGFVLLLIGISSFFFYPVFILIKDNIHIIFNLSGRNENIFTLLKFIFGSLLILPPTFLMGITYPLLVKDWSDKVKTARGISLLYAVNTLGGAFGAILSGILFIQFFGLRATLFFASVSSLLMGLAIIHFENRTNTVSDRKGKNVPKVKIEDKKEKDIKKIVFNKYFILIFLTGFLTFLFEVSLNRVFSTIFGSTAYSFSIILFTFLIGIFIGSILSGKLYDKKDMIEKLVFAFIIYMLILIFPLQHLNPIMLSLKIKLGIDVYIFFVLEFIIVFLILIIPAVLLGMIFPLIIYECSKHDEIGRISGFLYGINTIGSILGSLLSAIVIIPLIGVRTTLLTVPLLLVLYVIIFFKNKVFRIASFLLFLIIIFYPKWERWRFVENVFVTHAIFEKEDLNILFYKDSIYQNVSIVEYLDGTRALKLDGKSDASSAEDEFNQKFFGILPMLYHKNPDDVFILGLGSGSTTATVLKFPEVKRVDTIEIEPAVIEAARYFEKINKGIFSDPRSNIIINDARNFLLMYPEKKYDIITSHPSNPWLSGVSLLFTKDYFKLAASRLKHGGLFCQFFPQYQVDHTSIKVILKTISESFKYFHVWITLSDFAIICSNQPLMFDYLLIENRLENVKKEKDFGKVLFSGLYDNVETLSYQFLADEVGIRKYLLEFNEVNTDDRPIIEYRTPIFAFENHSFHILMDLIKKLPDATIRFHRDYESDDHGFIIKPINLYFAGDYMRYQGTDMNIKRKTLNFVFSYLDQLIEGITYKSYFRDETSQWTITTGRKYFERKKDLEQTIFSLIGENVDADNYRDFKYINKDENILLWYNENALFLYLIQKDGHIKPSDVDKFSIYKNEK